MKKLMRGLIIGSKFNKPGMASNAAKKIRPCEMAEAFVLASALILAELLTITEVWAIHLKGPIQNFLLRFKLAV